MKRKVLFFCIILNFVFLEKTFAYTTCNFEHVYMWGIYSSQEGSYVFDKNFTLDNVNVKRIQDNDYYYFDINAEAVLNDDLRCKFVNNSMGFGNSYEGAYTYYGWCGPYITKSDGIIPNSIGETHLLAKNRLKPFLYGEENFTDKKIQKTCNFDISNGGDCYHINEYLYIDNVLKARYYLNDQGTEVKQSVYHYIPYPIPEIRNYYGVAEDPYYYKIGVTRHLKLNDNIPSHDGFSLISNTCSVKECTYDTYKRIDMLVYKLATKIKIKKSMFENYRYFAYGGLTFLTSAKYYNDYVSGYSGIFSSTNTIDLNDYVDCEHEWEYTINKEEGTHRKYCNKCEWEIISSHSFDKEYDGIENNECECGLHKKIKYTYIIDDNNIATKSIICDVDSPVEKYEYTKKNGYEFLYYEKTEKIGNEKNIITNVATISDITGNNSVTYKAIYTPLLFTINYHTTIGEFQNKSKNITKKYNYLYFNSFENVFNLPQDETYFEGWKLNEEQIKSVEELKVYIISQNMSIDLYAMYRKPEIGRAERTIDGLSPSAEGGLVKKNKKEKSENKEVNKQKTKQLEENIKKEIKNKKELEDIEIYDMTKSEWQKIYGILGIKAASFSTITGENKYEIYGNINIIKIFLYIIKYKKEIFLSFLLLVLVSIVVMVKKEKNDKKTQM